MIPLLQTARELLQTQPTLHPKIFGADERLLPDVRQKIMKTADFMIRQRVSGLYGLKVADIVSVGSAGGYMYHENSDIDVRIFLETDNPTIKNLSFFCQCCCCAELDGDENPLPVFYVNGLFLDIAFAPVRYDSGGNYSVLNDRWATRPRKDNLAARFSPGEIVKGYYLFRRRIEKAIAEFDFSNGTAAAQNLYNLNRLRRSFFSIKYNLGQDYDANIKKFLIYRLFVRRKELKQLGVLLSQMENDFYFSPERTNHGQ